jgi:hypothetical protein
MLLLLYPANAWASPSFKVQVFEVSRESDQGDQIRRILGYCSIAYFGQCFENYRGSGAIFLAICFPGAGYVIIFTKKIDWATFWVTLWVTFSQTRLVTLNPTLMLLSGKPYI